jgi:hypothetical protein
MFRSSSPARLAIIVLMSLITTPLAWAAEPLLMQVGEGWAANSVNAVIFRGDPITTHGDRQYVAFYDAEGRVVIATRTLGQVEWKPTVTNLTGNVKDAHNSISILADGDGYLHVSWDHHGHPLRYVRSTAPGSLQFTEKMPMTGKVESRVTYPHFMQLPDGGLLFLYRDGASGRGNLAINRYDLETQTWTQLHGNLVSGENQRNAYWQATIDRHGTLHVSWVWRSSGDVATNHNLCYARSRDGGVTWEKSTGERYTLPITASTAEIAREIPQRHELINQTSMAADERGRPIIATYYREPGTQVVQYVLVHHDGTRWRHTQVGQRTTPFSLSGGGSKAIPIARPQVFARTIDGKTAAWVIFRDEERGTKVSLAACDDLANPAWTVRDLTDFPVRYWEPSYDHVRWQRDGVLNLYVQMVGQGDGERLEAVPPQPVYVLEWKP